MREKMEIAAFYAGAVLETAISLALLYWGSGGQSIVHQIATFLGFLMFPAVSICTIPAAFGLVGMWVVDKIADHYENVLNIS